MRFHQPIWASRDHGKIENCINRTRNEEKLARIAAFCEYPDLRFLAADKLSGPEHIVFAVSHAEKQGFRETALYIADKINDEYLLHDIINAVYASDGSRPVVELNKDALCYILFQRITDEQVLAEFLEDCSAFSEAALDRIRTKEIIARAGQRISPGATRLLMECANRSGDVSLLAKAAAGCSRHHLTSGEWKDMFGVLLRMPEYSEQAARQLSELENREAEKRRSKLEGQIADDLRRFPTTVFVQAEGTDNEEMIWRYWYGERVTEDTVCYLAGGLRWFRWVRFFPKGYLSGDVYNIQEVYFQGNPFRDWQYVLETLYEKRHDLREEICRLDHRIIYLGTDGSYSIRIEPHLDKIHVRFEKGPRYTIFEARLRIMENQTEKETISGMNIIIQNYIHYDSRELVEMMHEPRAVLSRDEMLWKVWLSFSLDIEKNRVLYELSHELRDLPWPQYFESGMAEHMLRSFDRRIYMDGDAIRKSELLNDLSCVLGKLYGNREDLREEILNLPVILFPKRFTGPLSYVILSFRETENGIEVSFDDDCEPAVYSDKFMDEMVMRILEQPYSS